VPAIGQARMRRTDVRPMRNRRAISALLTPARYSFRTWPVWSACGFAAAPDVCRSAGRGLNRRARVPAESPFRTRRRRPVMRPWPARQVWSDRVLRSAIRNRRRDVPVPEVLRAGPPPTDPNDPIATPARRRSRGGAQRPSNLSRSCRWAAPDPTSFTCMAMVQPRRAAYSRRARICNGMVCWSKVETRA